MIIKIGVLCSKIRIEEKLLFQEFEKLGLKIIQLDPRELTLTGSKDNFKGAELLLNREIGQTRSELILEYAENLGIKTINSSSSTILCNNKALTTQVLEKNNLPVPKTVLAFSQEEALIAAKRIGFPVVIKPVWGSWGRLISKADTYEALEAILEHKAALGSPQHSIFYLQKFIFKPGRDIRVFVVGGKAIAAMYRVSQHWLTNTAKGAVPQNMKLNKEITDLVEKAAKVLGVEIAGVDLVEHENGFLIFEVNATPEFHGLKAVSEVNIPLLIARYVQKEAENAKN